jgi:alpha-1,2-mannosyltransferase
MGEDGLRQSDAGSRQAFRWGLGGVSLVLFASFAIAMSRHAQVDFVVYRMGGGHVFGTGLYQAYVRTTVGHMGFTYTPLAALLSWPFSLVSIATGQLLWDLTNVAALTALIAVSSAAARGRQPQRTDWQTAIIAAPFALLLWPVRDGFQLGQVNVVLILIIVTDLTMALSWRGKRLPRGILVGTAAAIKLTPLIFIPYLVFTRQWVAARNAVLTFLAATGAMFAVAPSASWSYFTRYVFDARRIGSSIGTDNQTLRAALARTGLPIPHLVVDLLLVAVFCAGMVVAAKAYRRRSALLGILVCAATGLLLSPISWQHHYAWCVPLLAWLVFGVDRPKGHWVWAAIAAIAFAIVPPDRLTHIDNAGYLWENCYVVATLGFLILTAKLLRARTRSAASSTDGSPGCPPQSENSEPRARPRSTIHHTGKPTVGSKSS